MMIGKINSGIVNVNDKLNVIDAKKKIREQGKVTKIIKRYGF